MPWWANEILFPYNDKMQKFQGWSSRFIQIIFANIVIVVLLRSKFNNDWLLNHINPQGAIIDYELWNFIHIVLLSPSCTIFNWPIIYQ